jgi:hypothetical protein
MSKGAQGAQGDVSAKSLMLKESRVQGCRFIPLTSRLIFLPLSFTLITLFILIINRLEGMKPCFCAG